MVEDRALTVFRTHVISATRDVAPYAVLETGTTFRVKDPEATLVRWTTMRRALNAAFGNRSEPDGPRPIPGQ
jgi:hypothetical protein